MPTVKQKRGMAEYFEAKLQEGGATVEVVERKLIEDIVSHYLKVGDALVFCVDRTYPGGKFRRLVQAAKDKFENVVTIFYKDGKTFFRAAGAHAHSRRRRSLKLYSSKDANRMLLLRPEELFRRDRERFRWLQYYQPKSARLDEKILAVQLNPARFDYSHINPQEQFRPDDQNSRRIFEIVRRREYDGPLVVSGRYLVRPELA